MWLVGVGGIYWCGCKEVYRCPQTTYPYSYCICSFYNIPTFCSFFICFSFFNNYNLRNNICDQVVIYITDIGKTNIQLRDR